MTIEPQRQLRSNGAVIHSRSTCRQRHHRIADRLLQLAAVTIVLRAFIPLGYMPGDLTAGEFVVLCPTGVPAEIMQVLHRGHHDHDQTVVDIDQSCPIGTALQPAWIPLQETTSFVVTVPNESFTFYQRVTYLGILARRYDSRGPPIV